MSDDIGQMLGRIEGKLDQVGKSLDRHIDDDVRRFSDVYKVLGDHAEDINKAKGAKGALLWAAGGLATAAGFAASYVAKAMGWHQ